VRLSADEKLRREIAALYDVLAEALGTEKVVMRAGKLGTLKEMRSQAIPDRLLALSRLVFEDPTLETRPAKAQYKKMIAEIEDRLGDLVIECKEVRKAFGDRLLIESLSFSLPAGGIVGIIGVPMAPVVLLRMFVKEQRAFSLSGPSHRSMARALDLLEEWPEVRKVVTCTVPLEGTQAAFEGLVAGDGNAKVLVSAQD